MNTREAGFYIVKIHGVWEVAEYWKNQGGLFTWLRVAFINHYRDEDFEEILPEPILLPDQKIKEQ